MYCFRLCYLKEHIFQILVFAKFQDDAEIYFNVGALEQSMETISPPRFTFERQVLWWDGDARGVKAMTPLHYVNAQWIIYLNSQKLNLLSKLPVLLQNVCISQAFFQINKNISLSGNWTPVSRVTGGDTYHYTNKDSCERLSKLRELLLLTNFMI